MELYLNNSDKSGRDAVYAATEMIAGAIYSLNAAEGDGTDTDTRRYREFAVQWRGDDTPHSRTPYSHLHAALDGIWRRLALLDGFRNYDVEVIVEVTDENLFNLIGEHDPARRAYVLAVAERLDSAYADALDYQDEYAA